MPVPPLIAHRGDLERHPENTLPALEAAVAAGVPALEFDLQMTADGVPVLLHDTSLLRTAGVDADVRGLTLAQTREVSVAETARLGRGAGHVAMPTLEETVQCMARWPGVTFFVEIKAQSTKHFGVESVTRPVMELLAPVRERCVLISFSPKALRSVRKLGAERIGWCFEGMNAAHHERASAIAPDVLLTDWRTLGDEALWPGRWQWALWEVVEPERALALAERGADWIETMAPTSMLADPRLAAGRR